VLLKLIPGGVAVIAKLAMAPPVELIVNPVAAVFTVLVSAAKVRVNAGATKDDTVGAGVGGTYAGVVTGIDSAETGDVPSAVVAETVNVYLVCA
jgi:hypothetical protein